jgi:flagellin-like protein
MKSRAGLAEEAEAVSPVVSIVLFLAITVVLAAVVILIFNSGNTPSVPSQNVSFLRKAQTLEVIGAPAAPKMDWFTDVAVTGSCADHVLLQPVNDASPSVYPIAPGIPVSAGDALSNCAIGESLVLSLKTTTTVFYSVTF